MAYLFKRGRVYHVKYYRGGKQREKSLRTDSLQIAKERKRELESAIATGGANPLPTRTPLAEVLDEYVKHIRAVKSPKAAQCDIYYLREAFGPICDALRITSRTVTDKAKRRLSKSSKADRRRRLPVIEANAFEENTTRQIADFIDFKVRDQGLKPKTANHYRSIIRRVFNWANP